MGRRFQKNSGNLAVWLMLSGGALIGASCERMTVGSTDNRAEAAADDKVTVRFSCGGRQTRSLLGSGDSEIRELMVYAFSDGLQVGSAYDIQGESVSMELSKHCTYSFYATANLGRGVDCGDEDELRERSVKCGGWSSAAGVPMAASLEGVEIDKVSGSIELDMVRLSAKYHLVIEKNFNDGWFNVSGVGVKQEAGRVYPFMSGAKSDVYADGDEADHDEIYALNNGGSACFHVPENLQGVLLPDNTNPWAKIPDNIPGSSSACTYLEISGEWGCRGLSAPLTYRLYLGEDNCTDFNIIRNTERTVVLSLTDDGVDASSWKVTKGNVTDSRSLQFSVDSLFIVPDGRIYDAKVNVEPSGIPYVVEYDDDEFDDADVTLSQSGNTVSLSASSNVPADRSLEVLLKTEDGVTKDVLEVTVRHIGITAPYGVRIGYGQQSSINFEMQPSVSETGWTPEYRSSDSSVMSVQREEESDTQAIFSVNGVAGGKTKIYASYGPCEAEMDAIVEEQDGFTYSGLSGYVNGAAVQNAAVFPHLSDNLFSPIRLLSNSDETVVKVTRTAVHDSYLEDYADYAPDYGNIYGSSEFSIEPVGPGTAMLSFISDYPYYVGQRMITVVPVSGYYLTASCYNHSTGSTVNRGPGNLPKDFQFSASNGDELDVVFAPEIKGAFIVSVSVSHLSRTVTHSGWTDADYYSLSREGSHLNDCVWHLTGRDCKVEMEVIFGLNQETVLSTFTFSGS